MKRDLSQRKLESIIGVEASGTRLDLWLSNRFTYYSRNQWQTSIKSGMILLNNSKTRSSRKLQTGDIIKFVPLPQTEPEVDFNYEIVYEDDYFLVINKPSNLPCHPAGRFYCHTLWYKLISQLENVHIINRLDRETSGLVLVAKKPEIACKLSKLFANGTINKKYLMLVHGKFPETLTAKGYLTTDNTSEVRKKRCFKLSSNEVEGEFSHTDFECIQSNTNFSLVKVMPKTGRLHQIRATSCSLGYPLVGDKIYGINDNYYLKFIDNKLTDTDYDKLLISHQALHATSLSFKHPVTNKTMLFEVPMPADIKRVLMNA